jgi:hypothetical protein
MNLLHKIKRQFNNLVLKVRTLFARTPERLRHHVPYVSQFANPSWAEMILKDNQPIDRDLMWEDSGARSIKEYERWVLSICGMACTAMALQFYKKGEFKTIPLARDAAKLGVYKKDGDGISSMHYVPYIKWIRKFNLKGTIYTKISFTSLCYLLSKNRLVIASVNPNISSFISAPATQVGGHLVLITGYNKKEKTVTFQNPSGFENNQTQSNHTVSLKEFMIYFSGQGIALKNRS